MNTNQMTANRTEENYPHTYGNTSQNQSAGTAIEKDVPIVHEAEIITPQPYGVFALCKILEHFQIN